MHTLNNDSIFSSLQEVCINKYAYMQRNFLVKKLKNSGMSKIMCKNVGVKHPQNEDKIIVLKCCVECMSYIGMT